MSDTIITEARELIQEGFWVYPVDVDLKKPTIKDPRKTRLTGDEFEELFYRTHATGVAVDLALSDLVCIDVDAYKPECNWDTWCEENGIEIPETMMAHTQRGGIHYVFQAEEGKRYRGAIKGLKAVDVKHQGYIVVWPTPGYEWTNDLAPVDAPSWLPTRDEVQPVLAGPATLQSSVQDNMSGGARGQDDRGIRWLNEATGNPVELERGEDWFKLVGGMAQEYKGTIYEDAARQAVIDFALRWEGKHESEEETAERARKDFDSVNVVADGGVNLGSTKHVLRAYGILKEKRSKKTRVKSAAHMMKPSETEFATGFMKVEGDELLKKRLPQIDWIVNDVLPSGNFFSFAGPSGAGKTRLMALLAACLATGRTDVMGWASANRPVSVLLIANEERTVDMERRVKAAMIANGLKGGKPFYVRGKEQGRFVLTHSPEGMLELNEDLLDKMAEDIKAADIEVVVLDPFVTLGAGGEMDPEGIDLVNSFMMQLAERTGAAVGHIHHSPKDRAAPPDEQRGQDGAWRGHGSIYSALDVGFTIFPLMPYEVSSKKDKRRKLAEAQKNGMVDKYVVIDQAKQREGEDVPPVAFRFTSVRLHPDDDNGIGALLPVSVRHAEQMVRGAVEMEENAIDEQRLNMLAEGIPAAFGDNRFIRLNELHTYMRTRYGERWSNAQSIKMRDLLKRHPELETGVQFERGTFHLEAGEGRGMLGIYGV